MILLNKLEISCFNKKHVNNKHIYIWITENITGIISGLESKVVLYLLQDLFNDISKKNLFIHKQFLLQRYFDFTSNKTAGRTPINPFKLKGFLLHLPSHESQKHGDWR